MIRRLSVKKTAFVLIAFFSLITSFCMIKGNAEENVTSVSETNVVARNLNGKLDEFISIFLFTPISDTECDVRLADKTATRAIVPEKVELNGKEYTVTVIAANGFTSATKLEMVRLPKSVKTIGSNAFINCKALTTITLPAVETIGANAFAMTNMDYLIIPTTVTSVASTILRGANTQVYVRSALGDGATVPEGWVSNWNGNNKNQSVEFDSSFVPDVKYEFVSSEVATFALGDDVDLRNGDSIGKESTEPDPAHVHLYDYFPNFKTKGHTGKCYCGYEINSPHTISSLDVNRETATCLGCGASVNLKKDLYLIQFGPSPDPTNQMAQNYALIENYTTSNGKDFEEDSQD